MPYNLAAEYGALLILTVASIGLLFDKSIVSTRYKGLKWMYAATYLSILITLAAIISMDYYDGSYSLKLVDFLRQMYFITSPLLALLYLFYAINIVYNKMPINKIISKFYYLGIPYLLYLIFVLGNHWHRLIFSFSEQGAYIKGPLNQISYYIAFIYFALLIAFTIKHRFTAQRNILVIICFNFLLSTIIFSIQIFFPLVQLSGLACVSGLLVVHLYILNVSRSSDPLTELNNRQKLTSDLTMLCNNNTPFSLAVFSLRNFKSINERLGLEFGDQLLFDLGIRLRSILPAKYIYRYGGDEFAYLKINSDDGFNQLLKNVTDLICRPFSSGDNSLSLDIIYARIDYPEFGHNVKEVISAMDYSISSIKKNIGETNFFYDPGICELMKRRNYIIDRLKQAIAEDGFEVHYQPIYASAVDNFPLAEALIRLKKSDQPPLSPGEFIPIAEESGLVSKLTYIVLEKLCQDYRYLMDLYPNQLPLESISLNFPYVHFLQGRTTQEVCEIVDRYQIPHSMIKMELTERTLVADTQATRNIMDELIKQGFEFELDDFGVEYSNLSLFFDIPVEIIKFDRSLVYAATSTPDRRIFFDHLLQAIKAMNIKVVMEGVEGEELVKYLINSGCDYIQGYAFSKPLPRDEFGQYLIDFQQQKGKQA